jgi:hypothetical protein
VTLPPGSAFGPEETASFGFSRTMAVPDILDWLATSSDFITAPAAVRAANLALSRDALLSRAVRGADVSEAVVQMPMRSWCWRAARR